MKSIVKFEFDNNAAAQAFLTWLCEQGEQDYYFWMRHGDDGEEDKNIVGFDYFHGPKNENGGKEFCPNLTVIAANMRKD